MVVRLFLLVAALFAVAAVALFVLKAFSYPMIGTMAITFALGAAAAKLLGSRRSGGATRL